MNNGTQRDARKALPQLEGLRDDLSPEVRSAVRQALWELTLKAAASRDDGSILKISHIGGRVIQAGGESFGGERGRESAKWEAALNELEIEGLVVGRGYKGEVYELTHEGWAVADAL